MLTDSCTWEDDCYSGQSFKSISMATLLDFGHMQADMSILAAENRRSFNRLLDRVGTIILNEVQQSLIAKPVPFHFMRADIGISIAETLEMLTKG
jgi:hypothetical protein